MFGTARPREAILRERGVEVGSMDSERVTDRFSAVNSHSRAGSVTSGFSEETDQWHTVGKTGKAKPR